MISALRPGHPLVQPASTADGTAVADHPLGEDTWISMINPDGALVPVRGSTVLRPGDELLLLTDPDGDDDPTPLFTAPGPSQPPNVPAVP